MGRAWDLEFRLSDLEAKVGADIQLDLANKSLGESQTAIVASPLVYFRRVLGDSQRYSVLGAKLDLSTFAKSIAKGKIGLFLGADVSKIVASDWAGGRYWLVAPYMNGSWSVRAGISARLPNKGN